MNNFDADQSGLYRRINITLILVLFLFSYLCQGSLPDTIPVRYGVSGEPVFWAAVPVYALFLMTFLYIYIIIAFTVRIGRLIIRLTKEQEAEKL